MAETDPDKLNTPAKDGLDLAGKILIATPAMMDPRFERAVIYMCAYDEEQAMGLVINNSHDDLHLSDLLLSLNIPNVPKRLNGPVLSGGPVEPERGFVLHSPDGYDGPASLHVTDTLTLTTTKDILFALGSDDAPKSARMALGYAGWSAGQLERELMENAWLVADIDDALIFSEDLDGLWTQALASLGIKPEMLSSLSGHA